MSPLPAVKNFRFHDFRHTAIINMRRAGIDPPTIMQISDHKTMVCFTRYNSFRESDLRAAARTALSLFASAASAVPRYTPVARPG